MGFAAFLIARFGLKPERLGWPIREVRATLATAIGPVDRLAHNKGCIDFSRKAHGLQSVGSSEKISQQALTSGGQTIRSASPAAVEFFHPVRFFSGRELGDTTLATKVAADVCSFAL
jgi:hypothetical protein